MRLAVLPLALAVLTAPVSGEPVAKEKPVVLAPFSVKGDPVNSFAFDLVVQLDPKTKRIARLWIDGVREGSDAEKSGLRKGDEIVKLNGKAVTEFAPDFTPAGELNKLLLNRPAGERLDLEVLTRRTLNVTVRAAGPALAW